MCEGEREREGRLRAGEKSGRACWLKTSVFAHPPVMVHFDHTALADTAVVRTYRLKGVFTALAAAIPEVSSSTPRRSAVGKHLDVILLAVERGLRVLGHRARIRCHRPKVAHHAQDSHNVEGHQVSEVPT